MNAVMSGSIKSALVVDDEEFSKDNLCEKLMTLGVSTVYGSSNGLAAIGVLDQMANPPDLILCDIFMPDMDGIEFLGELAKRRYQGGLILVTGVNKAMLEVAQDIALAKELRVLGAFIKPLSRQSLATALGISVK